VTLLATVCPCFGQDPANVPAVPEAQMTLPKLADMELPTAEELLRARPFDWIVLKGDGVLVVEPIGVRPDLLGRLTIRHEMAVRDYERLLKHRPYREAEIHSQRQFTKDERLLKELESREVALKSELDQARERMEALKPATARFAVTLRDGSVDPEYVLEARHVDSIVYFEDLLLQRADQLIAEGKTALAYDLLLVVAGRFRDSAAPVRSELEAVESRLAGRIAELDNERKLLRAAREELNQAKNRNLPGLKIRLMALDKTVVAIPAELKDLEADLADVRFKLRFTRPRDFPNPDPPRNDDLLLPNWPRFDEVHLRLVLKDAEQHLEQGQPAEALRLLDEVWRPGSNPPQWNERLGQTIDRLIEPCLEGEDYRQARFYLTHLTTRAADHPVAVHWRGELLRRATGLIEEARAASSNGDSIAAARQIDRAARVWPETPGLREAHRELTDRHQVLKVGVLKLGRTSRNGEFPDEATERVLGLTEARLFQPVSSSPQGVRYRSAFFDSWEPTDLGRKVRFRLRLARSDWESRAVITAADLLAEFQARIQPGSPREDERLAGFVNGITVHSPTELTLDFQQLPLRPEAVWQITVPLGEPSRSLNPDLQVDSNELGRERFQCIARDETQATYRRVRKQPSGARQRRVQDVQEIVYESWDYQLQGLLRGEISLVPTSVVPDLKLLQEDNRFIVIPRALPSTHILLFHPASTALRDGQFRRALLHSVPRQRLMTETLIPGMPTSGRLVTSPFSTKSYGYPRQLEPFEYDLPLAAALALTAKKQFKAELPTLKFLVPDHPVHRAAAEQMIAEWKRIGVQVVLVESASEEWDLSYRTVRSVEPLLDLWPLLTLQATARVEPLQALPEGTRHGLLELERTSDWTTAVRLLHRLQRELLVDARYIPLWEIDEFLIARRNITGIPERPMSVYDDIERWTVGAWFPTESP